MSHTVLQYPHWLFARSVDIIPHAWDAGLQDNRHGLLLSGVTGNTGFEGDTGSTGLTGRNMFSPPICMQI